MRRSPPMFRGRNDDLASRGRVCGERSPEIPEDLIEPQLVERIHHSRAPNSDAADDAASLISGAKFANDLAERPMTSSARARLHAVAREAAHVEEVVDQACFDLDVSLYDVERRAQRFGTSERCEATSPCENRRERPCAARGKARRKTIARLARWPLRRLPRLKRLRSALGAGARFLRRRCSVRSMTAVENRSRSSRPFGATCVTSRSG